MLNVKVLIALLVSLFLMSPASAHLYRKDVCYAYKQTPTTVLISPLRYQGLQSKGLMTQTGAVKSFLSFLTKAPSEMKNFMRCVGKAVDRFPALQNGFSLSFSFSGASKSGQATQKTPLQLVLKAPIFYAGTHFMTRLDTKQPIQLKQPYSSFNDYRHLLFELDDKGNEYGTGYRGLYKNHALNALGMPKKNHSHRKDQIDNGYSIAFKELGGDIVIIPKGGYVSLYDFAKKASAQEQVSFWRMVLERMNELDKQKMPYRFISVAGSAAGQRIAHFSVRLEITL